MTGFNCDTHTETTPMTPDLRSVLVRLLDAVDSAPSADDIPFPLRGLFDELRAEVIADKDARDSLAVPTDHLFLTPQFARLTRTQWRLFAAIHIAANHAGGMTGLMDSGRHDEIAAKAVKLADRVMRVNDEFDRPSPPAKSAAVTVAESTPGLPAFAVAYLEWLAFHGPALTTEGPQNLDAAHHSDARRHLLKAGLAAWVLGDQIAATPKGLKAAGIGAVERPGDVLKLGPQEEAA